jgi:hypothetical protein
MKSYSRIIGTLLILSSLNGIAQEEKSKPIKKIKLKDIYVQQGLFLDWNKLGSINDFRTLAPQSVLLKAPLDEYMQAYGTHTSGNTAFTFLTGFQLRNSDKSGYKINPYFRIGAMFYSNTSVSCFAVKEDKKTIDTLSSAQTGKTIYVDSLNTKSYNLNYTSSQLRIDASMLIRSNPEKRWSVYTGIGITAGLSMLAKTEIYYNEYKGTQTVDGSDGGILSYDYSFTENTKTEKFKNKPSLGGAVYLPLGISFRLGNKRAFWKRTNIYYEFKPGMNITHIPNLKTQATACLLHGIGLRISVN